MTAQISLFDDIPTDVPETSLPAQVFDTSREQGHLLIAAGPPRTGQDWLFLNEGDATIKCCLPGWDTAVQLDAEQLRVLGQYCLDMAERIERRT